MKYIEKLPEPITFADWKKLHPGANYNDHLSRASSVKNTLKNTLLQEQKYICCYCECRIDTDHSHIEHFRPKGHPEFAGLQLDYANLHASCTKLPTGSAEEHCGHKKGDVFSEELISPLERDCSSHFTYGMDGRIHGADERGKMTISILRLDSELLNSQRKALIDSFLDIEDEEVLMEEISAHLDMNKPKLGEFCSMIDYLHHTHQL